MLTSHGGKARAFLSVTLVIWVATLAVGSASGKADTRHWRRFVVPGAHCGDGSEYNILISDGNPRKLAFDMMGGGACWSESTCYAPTPLAWTHEIPFVFEKSGFVSLDADRSPVFDYTVVYFPYCTGDVHLGQHVAEYLSPTKVYHVGRTNIELSLQYLTDNHLVSFDDLDSFVFYGYSAGALGALYHVFNVAPLVDQTPNKVLVLDSPGLEFGPKFWDKFPAEWIQDVQSAMARVGFQVQPGSGDIASVIPAVCGRLPDWRVAVLQGSRDIIMSDLFGAISQDGFERMIFGPTGLYALTEDPTDNCSAWVPTSAMHTFLLTDTTANISAGGKTAMEFVFDAVFGTGGRNYRDPASGAATVTAK